MKVLVTISTAFVIAALVIAILAFPTMWLWNYLMPTIFGLTKINLTQSLCLNLLSWILFGSKSSSSKK